MKKLFAHVLLLNRQSFDELSRFSNFRSIIGFKSTINPKMNIQYTIHHKLINSSKIIKKNSSKMNIEFIQN